MKNGNLSKGDFIKCHDAEDAANVADALQQDGYDWDFVYEHNGEKGIWIEILGVIERSGKSYREQSGDVSRSENPNTCGDAISREQLIRELNAQMAVGAITREIALDMLTHLLSVTPQPRTGRWITSHIPESVLCECSVCGFTCGAYSFNYCPMCGAKMQEVENGRSQGF